MTIFERSVLIGRNAVYVQRRAYALARCGSTAACPSMGALELVIDRAPLWP